MERQVVVKNVKHDRGNRMIEVHVGAVEVDGNSTVHVGEHTYGITATALRDGWNGQIENWLGWVKATHLALTDNVPVETVAKALGFKGKVL